MAGFSSIDNFVSEVTAGKFWRQEFFKLYAGGTAIAGNWYDLAQGNGCPAQYLHGNLCLNADFQTSADPWTLGVGWAYTPATHLLTCASASGSNTAVTQTLRLKAGCYYYVVYTSGRTAGGTTISLGGTAGTLRSTAATFREIIQCGTTDKTVSILPNSTFTGTIDLVSVQQILDFLPYNDATEGALYHGPSVSTDTKHLVNFGAWANFATGLPVVLKLVDVLGTYPYIDCTSAAVQVLDGGLGAQTIVGTVIDNCQDAWNEEVITNVTSTLVVKATESVPGGSANLSCCKFAITDVFTTGKICDEVVAINMTRAEFVYIWLRSSTNLNSGDLSWCTDETSLLASSQDTVISTALTANTWTRVKIDVSAVAKTDLDAVISIGLKANIDKNITYNLYVDDVMFIREDPVIYNGKFTGNANGWTVGGTWAYRSNDVERTAGADGLTLEQTLLPVVQRCPYQVVYTISNRSAGGVTVSLGGTAGTQRVADGTYTETITCGTTNFTLAFTPDATFNGRIDNIYVWPMIPRCDETGEGVRMFYVIDNNITNGAGASAVSVNYTNQAGTAQRSLGGTIVNTASDVVAHLPHSGVVAGKYGPSLPFQAGDYGIRSVQSFQFSGAQASGGVNLVLYKDIASIPITTAYVAAERDLMNQLPSLPRIRDGACLMFLVFVGGVIAAGSQIQGYIDTAWS